jgi:uncharacterized protein
MAIRIEKSFQVQAPIETVWRLLSDPRKIAGCIPGAQVTDAVEGGIYKGVIKVKVGPSVTDYKGEARIERLDQEAHEIDITGKGQDVRGKGSASMKMTGKARTLPEGGTEVVTTTEVNVVGLLAQLGARMIQEVSNQMFAEFVKNLRNQLQQEGTGQEPSSTGTKEPEPVKAVPLILSAIKQSGSDLLRKIGGGSPPGKEPES